MRLAPGVGALAVAVGFGALEAAETAPHAPLNVRAAYDAADGTVGIEWDRSLGALRYEVAASGTVVYSGGWDTVATLIAPRGTRSYTVRACRAVCGAWTDPVSVKVTAAPPTGIRFGGGFSDIVWTPNAFRWEYDQPLYHHAPGEIDGGYGTYRISATSTRLLGSSRRAVIWTAFESAGPSGAESLSGRFFLVSGVRSAVDRFSLAFDADADNRAVLNAGFFVATWDGRSGWQARNNLGAGESFTPLPSDVAVAVGYRSATSVGIDSLKSLVPDRPFPPGIRYGEGATDLVFLANALGYGTHTAGDMRISDGVYRLPDGERRRIPGDVQTTLITPFEPGPTAYDTVVRGDDRVGRFFVVSGKESAVDRFSLTFPQAKEDLAVLRAGFFIAVWTGAPGGWRAVNNEGIEEAFVPRASDVVVAVGHRASTASPGMDSLRPLVPRAVLSPRRQVLALATSVGHVYRIEFGRNLVTDAVDLGSFAPVTLPSGIAHLSPGVALVIDWHNDHLHRLEYTDEAVTTVTDLGSVSTAYNGYDIAPQSLAHAAPGVALVADQRSRRLLRIEYTAAAVTAVTEVPGLTLPWYPWGMARIGDGTVLVADTWWDGLYRVEYGKETPTSTWLDYLWGLHEPTGMAHVSDGVALVSDNGDPDPLFRVEYGDSSVTKVTNLGVVAGLRGLNGLTALPNGAPAAGSDTATTAEGAAVSIDVLANDSDPDGDALTLASVVQPVNGTAAIETDGTVTYTPKAGFSGQDSFTYAVSDGTNESTATVTVTVRPPFAVYDPDANTITVTLAGLDGSRFEVEETINGISTVHTVTASTYTRATPASAAYAYRIRACDQEGCGTWSRRRGFTIGTPSISYAGDADTGTFTVNWKKNYMLAMDPGSGDWSYTPPTASPSSQTFEDMPSGTYRFRLYSCIYVPGDTQAPGSQGTWTCTWSADRLTVTLDRDAESTLATSSEAGSSQYSTVVHPNGSARIEVPLRTIAGVHGMALSLSLRYDSARHTAISDIYATDDSLGFGWRLAGIPLLHRCRGGAGGTLALDNTDRLCLDGNPLVATTGDYWSVETEYRTEIQTHIKIVQRGTADEQWFEAKWPDGHTGTFGRTGSRARAGGRRTTGVSDLTPWSFSPNPYYQWGLDRMEHPFGNHLTVAYTVDDAHGALNPTSVTYDDAEVQFKYGSRGDLEANIIGTPVVGRIRRNSVLHTVRVRFDGNTVREYRLDSNTAGGRTRLENIQECGYAQTGAFDACLRPLALEWTSVAGAPADFGIGVSKVTDGRGSDTEFRYRAVSGNQHALNYAEAPFGALIAGTGVQAVEQVVVSEVRRDDGRGHDRGFHYRYKGAPQRSTLGRGYLGFPETRIRDAEAQTYTYRQTRMDWPFHGSTAVALVLDGLHGGNDRTYAKAENAYAALPMHGGSVKYPYLARATRWIYEANTVVGGSELVNTLVQSGEFVTRRTSTSTTGNTVSKPAFTATVWGDVPDRAIGSVKQTVTTVENYTNTNTTTEWTIGKVLGRTVTYAAAGETTRTVDTTYTYRAGSRVVDTETRMPDHATLTLATDRAFDAAGHVTGETTTGDGIAARTTSYGTYTEDRYPSSLTNALNQTVGIVYDLRFGEPKQLTDPNSNVSSIGYDAFGRKVLEMAPDGTSTTTTYERCGAAGVVCPDVPNAEEAVKVTTTVTNGTTQTAPNRVVYLDVLGRVVVSDEEAFDSTDGWRRQHREYDTQGRLKHVSRPYFSTGTAPRCATTGTCTSYHYDASFTQRIVTRAGGGTVRTDRSGTAGTTTVDTTEQTVSPSATLRKRTKLDVLGRVVETVGDYGSNDAVTTTYAYDAQGNLDKVVVDGVTTATMAYDEIGHRTTLTDASLGSWSYDYNALSELTSQTDAKGQKTSYAYDVLGRPTQRRDCVSGCSPTVTNTWTWDPTNATGELASTTNGAFTETYTYRATDGKPTGVATSIAVTGVLTASYSRTLGYDTAGRPSTVSHPDGTTYTHTYTARGHPKAVKHGTTVLHEFKAADAFGNVTREEFNGNAFATVRTFDADTGRLTAIRTGTARAPKSVQDLEYQWREDAVLHRRIDRRGTAATVDDLTDTFTMDGLSRTTRQATTGDATRTLDFAYDDRGNLTSKTSSVAGDLDATAYTYGTTGKPDRLTRATLGGVANTLSHDANGNVTGYDAATGDDTAVAYDGANRVVSITVGAPASPTAKDEFRHRPDGSRFLRRETWQDGETSKSALTVHLGDYEETRPSAGSYSKIQRVRASPGVVRVRRTAAAGSSSASGSRFEYLHRDHLGSLDRVTDGAGADAATLAAASFDPFGGRREADRSSDATAATLANVLALQAERFGRGFGGHEELSRTGFVHMNGRVYDPRLGRFLQPDPVVAAPGSGQGYNRYAYVLNRPLSLADPTGLTPVPPGATALGMAPVDINTLILGELWDYVGWADLPVYELTGFDSIMARGLTNAGLNTYLRTKIRIEECGSGGCVEWGTFVGRAERWLFGRMPGWVWMMGYASNLAAPGFHVYAHTSPEICRADEAGCTLENIVEALNAVGVHADQTRPFVPGERVR